MENVIEITLFTFIPIKLVIAASCAVDLMAIPILVLYMRIYSITMKIKATNIINICVEDIVKFVNSYTLVFITFGKGLVSEPMVSITAFCRIMETPIALISWELLEPDLIDLKAVNSIKAPKIPDTAKDMINEAIILSFKR